MLTDMWFCDELKLFVFMSNDARGPFDAAVEEIAERFQHQLRVYWGDPVIGASVLEDFGLTPSHAPTVVAQRTQPAERLTKWRMVDMPMGKEPLTVGSLLAFAREIVDHA